MKLVPRLRARRAAELRGVRDQSPRLRLRLRVRLHRATLDRQLSEGRPTGEPRERALRAHQLADRVTRRRLAKALRSLIADAELPMVARMYSAVPVSRNAILPWRQALLGVAERLEGDGAVDPCGMARLMVLLSDGRSPIYNPQDADRMSDAIWWIADGLSSP
jgi:hypothetical protein